MGADWGFAETGAAGPTGNRYGDAAGHACLAVSGAVERVITLETGAPGREANMRAFADRAVPPGRRGAGMIRACAKAAAARPWRGTFEG